MLYEFIDMHREEIIARCRAKAKARTVPPPVDVDIDRGVPLFLTQLGDMLRRGTSTGEIRTSASLHGRDLLRQGLTVSQVVHDYGDICQSITEVAVDADAPISTDDFRLL